MKHTKILAISLLIIAMAFMLQGCGKKEVEQQPTVTEPVVETPVQKEETPAPAPEKEETKQFITVRPLIAMLDNHWDAQPQSGISDAKIMYEVYAEGSITRYMAVFEQTDKRIGPVRSARPYFVELTGDYGAYYAHCGGSQEAYDMIALEDVYDLEAMRATVKNFWRDNSRSAPHNLYTDYEHALKELRESNLPEYDGRNSLVYSPDFKVYENGTDSTEMTINYRNKGKVDPGQKVTYMYDESLKTYQRYVNGKPFADKEVEGQLNYQNVIIQVASMKKAPNGVHEIIDVIGSGEGLYFTGGKYVKITWEKKSFAESTVFMVDGEKLVLNDGKLFIQVVPSLDKVSIK